MVLRDPTGRYHDWGRPGAKFDTAEDALAYLILQRTQHRPAPAA